MKSFYQFWVCFLGSLVMSCSLAKRQDVPEGSIARVFDTYLYQSDIADVVPSGASPSDSLSLVKQYIDNWAREQLVMRKAYQNLDGDSLDVLVEKQLQVYKRSLINYIYEKELVKQKLDTLISDVEIEKYYNDNQRNFELKDNIVKVCYVKVHKKAPKIDKLRLLYKSSDVKDKATLENYCRQYAQNYFIDDHTWLLFDDLLKEVPIQAYNKELFIQNNRFIEVADSASYYFVNVKEFKIKNGTSPLSFEKENIRNIILNKRKVELISSMKQDLFNNAGNNFEVY